VDNISVLIRVISGQYFRGSKHHTFINQAFLPEVHQKSQFHIWVH